MNESATELNALAAALAKLLVDGLEDADIRLLAQFVMVLQNAIRTYIA